MPRAKTLKLATFNVNGIGTRLRQRIVDRVCTGIVRMTLDLEQLDFRMLIDKLGGAVKHAGKLVSDFG